MLYNIQALRAVAAAMVVVFHLQSVLALGGIGADGVFFGQAGVDLFFVISGFVMVHATARRPVTEGAFLANRAFRVVPLYWLLTGVACLLPLLAPSLFKVFAPDAADLLRSLLFVPYVNAKGAVAPVLVVGWTLNYEMAFYLVFATGLAVARGRIGLTVAWVVAAQVGAVTVGLLAKPAGVAGRFFTDDLLLEFGFGMLLALAWLRGWVAGRALGALLLAVGFAALITGTAWWDSLPRSLVSGLPAVAVVAGAIGLEQAGWRAAARSLQLLGAASYSLYLSHLFVLGAAVRAGQGLTGAAAAVSFAALTFLVASGAALALYLAVERPLTRALRRWAGHDRTASEFRA